MEKLEDKILDKMLIEEIKELRKRIAENMPNYQKLLIQASKGFKYEAWVNADGFEERDFNVTTEDKNKENWPLYVVVGKDYVSAIDFEASKDLETLKELGLISIETEIEKKILNLCDGTHEEYGHKVYPVSITDKGKEYL